MGSSFGGTVKLSGESEYRRAIKQITVNLKEMSSELKLTTIQFQNEEKSVAETKQEYSGINAKVKEQKEYIKSLKQTLEKLTNEYGENNEKVKIFKTQLNKAETELSQMEKQTNLSNDELKNMKKNLDDTGRSGLKFGDVIKANVISDVIITGIHKLGSAMLELGRSCINIGKQAFEGFAEYEQLIDGVETLFKESAETVKSYADNAYKTAGLSANEYMNTVTSFSASLLSSLNGDTAKSAKAADMAITDMSDNANKMGTSMESIQNAYQGFAKQNYTMLDNLKLGYGRNKRRNAKIIKRCTKD